MRKLLTMAALFTASVLCGDIAGWKKRAVYQILTDRFWRSNGDTSLCDLHNYCGGDFAGMEQQL